MVDHMTNARKFQISLIAIVVLQLAVFGVPFWWGLFFLPFQAAAGFALGYYGMAAYMERKSAKEVARDESRW